MASDNDRSRSASPAREPKSKKSKTSGGFRWKEKRPRDEEPDARPGGRLERGYRDRSPRRESRRDKDEDREKPSRREKDEEPSIPTRKDDPQDPKPERSSDLKSKFGDYEPPPSKPTPSTDTPTSTTDKPKKEKKKKDKKPVTSNEPMIIVNVNDRLGTKAAIPCLASDSVKAFKAMVAAHIGRQPHEIMIKRQGERPFKDVLSLEDYGVSSGVQLDLELDTGD